MAADVVQAWNGDGDASQYASRRRAASRSTAFDVTTGGAYFQPGTCLTGGFAAAGPRPS
jgi:hypothetical protein